MCGVCVMCAWCVRGVRGVCVMCAWCVCDVCVVCACMGVGWVCADMMRSVCLGVMCTGDTGGHILVCMVVIETCGGDGVCEVH